MIIGGGFGGLSVARSLRRADVVLIDRTNHHLFQPLLYQVATAALSPSDIAWPLRTIFRSRPNIRVVMDEALSIDRAARLVRLRDSTPVAFDILVIAPGSRHAYFGHDEWEPFAPGLKTMADAVRLREKMLLAFEEAERRRIMTGTQDRLTFVIVGGGPTGVELAGALAEIGRKAMGPDFPTLQLDDLAIVLVEGGPRILPSFSEDLSAKATTALARMGVTIRLNSPVSAIRADGVMIGDEFVPATSSRAISHRTGEEFHGDLGLRSNPSARRPTLLCLPPHCNQSQGFPRILSWVLPSPGLSCLLSCFTPSLQPPTTLAPPLANLSSNARRGRPKKISKRGSGGDAKRCGHRRNFKRTPPTLTITWARPCTIAGT